MDAADSLTLARLLTLAALTAATCQYAEIVRRRTMRRRVDLDRSAAEEAGLRGLVRLFLVDPLSHKTEPTYRPE